MNFTPETFRNDDEKDSTYRNTRDYIDEKQIRQMITEYIKQPQVVHESTSKRRRGRSVYSEKVGTPLKLSTTPALFRERHWTAAETSPSLQRTNSPGRDDSSPRGDEYKQRLLPLKYSTMDSPLSKRSRDLTSSLSSFASPMPPSMFTPPSASVPPPGYHAPQASERNVKSYRKGLAFLDMS
ncbi:hypothetical protein C0992_003763 [Termitomyces sp. T32_za158]|nr:hypothetical protein C0992_003763 [Termitomyces sp. T32_za158]